MTDTIIKNTGNSRSIRSVPNLAALAPTWEKALEMLISEAGLPIDMGPLNPLGVDVMGTPLDSEHLITVEIGRYSGTGQGGKDNQVILHFSSTPKFILVSSLDSFSRADGFGFMFPDRTLGVSFYYTPSVMAQGLYLSVDGGTVSYYASVGSSDGYRMLNGQRGYSYIAFL